MKLKLSKVGFGAWGLGGDAYGPVADEEALDALKTAYEKGINFIDTSDLYGNGKSEKMIGKFLKKLSNHDKEGLYLSSKGGCLPHRGFDMPQNFTFDYLRSALDASLNRLGVDNLYVYFLHSPTTNEIQLEEMSKFCEYAIKSGKVLKTGISVKSPQDILFFNKKLKNINAYQFNFNLIDQRILKEPLISYFKNSQNIHIARTPLCFGFLTGKVSIEECFSEDDHRRNWPVEQLQQWRDSTKLFTKIAKDLDLSTTQLALLFCISYNFISCTIPGIINKKHAFENSSILSKEALKKEILLKIEEIYNNNNFYNPKLKENALKEELSKKKND